MSESILFVSAKGGVGKTLITANIGAALAMEGKKVLLLDLCPGSPGLDMASGMEKDVNYHLLDILEGNCKIIDAIVRSREVQSLYLLPAPLGRTSELGAESVLKLIGILKKGFDYLMIDTPDGNSAVTRGLLPSADRIVFVSSPDPVAVRNGIRLVKTFEKGELKKSSLLLNGIRTDLLKSREQQAPETVLEAFRLPLLGAVRYDDDIYVAASGGKLAAGLRSSAAKAFTNIAGRLLGEEISVDLRDRRKDG